MGGGQKKKAVQVRGILKLRTHSTFSAPTVPSAPIIAIEHSAVVRRKSMQMCEKGICSEFWLLKWKSLRVSGTSQEHLSHTDLIFRIYITRCFALRAFCVVFNEENRQRQHCKSNSPEDNVTRPVDTLRPCWIETSAAHSLCRTKNCVKYLKAL